MTDTINLTVRSPEVVEFSDSRETSPEVGLAILILAGGDVTLADRIWDAPTEAEIKAVEAFARTIAAPAERVLFWGQSIVGRAA